MSPLAWMARNHVAANILMAILLIGGMILSQNIKQEVFPQTPADSVNISVVYPGASPQEVESGLILPIEEALDGLKGVDTIRSTANEGLASVTVELLSDEDPDLLSLDIKSAVDRITTFPLDAEEPVIAVADPIDSVITLVVAGSISEKELTDLSEDIRDELMELPSISQVDMRGTRPQEISIEIPEARLRAYQLTLEQVAEKIRQASVDLPGGTIKTEGGDILIRTLEKKFIGEKYAQISILSFPDGRQLKLGEIGTVRDNFEDLEEQTLFNGVPAVLLTIQRVGDQTPFEIAETVKKYRQDRSPSLPQGVFLEFWDDRSDFLRQRMDLLKRNAYLGLVLVFVVLGLFLELRLAFWVMLGIPISFVGAFFIFPILGVSINMISLFAFILCLGIVVDDAIVVGEAIYSQRQRGKPMLQATVNGVKDVASPVIFAVLTTIILFSPMLFTDGNLEHLIKVIPLIVIPVLLLSLVESLFILPAHLSMGKRPSKGFFSRLENFRQRFDEALARFVEGPFARFVSRAIEQRYVTLAICLGILILTFGLIGGGFVRFEFFPGIESDLVKAAVRFPTGTPLEMTGQWHKKIQDSAYEMIREIDAQTNQNNLKHEISSIGAVTVINNHGKISYSSGSHLAEVSLLLSPGENRSLATSYFENAWREKVGPIPGAESLVFSSVSTKADKDIDIEISHPDPETLRLLTQEIKKALTDFSGISEVEDNNPLGKEEIRLTLKDNAKALGITEEALGRQVRSAFYGAEALRLQRGRHEIKVMVRYPEENRRQVHQLENLIIQTPQGGEIFLKDAATISLDREFGQIMRKNRRRLVNVYARVDRQLTSPDDILSQLKQSLFVDLKQQYPRLSIHEAGEQEDQGKFQRSLMRGSVIGLCAVFGLLAIAFKSYLQPFLVLSAIPFGLVGAMIGHALLGHSISMLSLCGLVALSGVVINDSLILIDMINRRYRGGDDLLSALVTASKARFRPIILTSLTTFFGIMPMIFETSFQAQFLVPMAISLGFGVLFATVIILVFVPALYFILNDLENITKLSLITPGETVMPNRGSGGPDDS